MWVTLECPHCQSCYRVGSERLNALPEHVRCAKCGQIFPRPPAPTAETPSQRQQVSCAPAAKKILIVDDSKLFRSMLLDVLRPLKMTILQAEKAEEALGLLVREKPCLLILDLNLPGMSGIELLRLVRSNPDLAGVRVLVVSGQAREGRTTDQASKWADLVMGKSFKPEQLLAQVRQLLGVGG